MSRAGPCGVAAARGGGGGGRAGQPPPAPPGGRTGPGAGAMSRRRRWRPWWIHTARCGRVPAPPATPPAGGLRGRREHPDECKVLRARARAPMRTTMETDGGGAARRRGARAPGGPRAGRACGARDGHRRAPLATARATVAGDAARHAAGSDAARWPTLVHRQPPAECAAPGRHELAARGLVGVVGGGGGARERSRATRARAAHASQPQTPRGGGRGGGGSGGGGGDRRRARRPDRTRAGVNGAPAAADVPCGAGRAVRFPQRRTGSVDADGDRLDADGGDGGRGGSARSVAAAAPITIASKRRRAR